MDRKIGLPERLLVLNLSNDALTGPLPSTVGALSRLKTLNLGDNRLSGELPPELASLTTLESLSLSWNTFVGSYEQTKTKFHVSQYHCTSSDFLILRKKRCEFVVSRSRRPGKLMHVCDSSNPGVINDKKYNYKKK